jgi:AcrR family transcriptional regulator
MKQERVSTRIRRKAVLSAALECFTEQDVESVSMAEICARSGASIGSVYHHFENKEGIVVALIADGLQAHLDALQDALGRAENQPRQGVDAVVGSLIDWIEAHPGWATFIYSNLHRSGASSAEPVQVVNRRYNEVVDGFFAPLIEAGRIRALPPECWPSLIAAPIHDYARRWLRGQVSPSPSSRRAVFVDAACRIVEPGHRMQESGK